MTKNLSNINTIRNALNTLYPMYKTYMELNQLKAQLEQATATNSFSLSDKKFTKMTRGKPLA